MRQEAKQALTHPWMKWIQTKFTLCRDGQLNTLQELPFSLPLDIDFLLFIYKAAGKTGRRQERYALSLWATSVLNPSHEGLYEFLSGQVLITKIKETIGPGRWVDMRAFLSSAWEVDVSLPALSSDRELCGKDSPPTSKHIRRKTQDNRLAAHHDSCIWPQVRFSGP